MNFAKLRTGLVRISLVLILLFLTSSQITAVPNPIGKSTGKGLLSIDTDRTILKVRTAQLVGGKRIIASSYNGELLSINFNGKIDWIKSLSGYMNHDLWCADITGDGVDEILAANADGTVYCLNSQGELMWEFKPNDVPMYSVCTLKSGQKNLVVCGGYDKSIYYLSGTGELVKEVSSYGYSEENPWNYSKAVPDKGCHIANFLRPVQTTDHGEVLALHGVIHTMAMVGRGAVYFFEPLEMKPYQVMRLKRGRPLGEMRVFDANQDGSEELYFGTSTLKNAHLLRVDPVSGKQKLVEIDPIRGDIDRFGYRIVRPELIEDNGKQRVMALYGANILLFSGDPDNQEVEILTTKYSFYDHWRDGEKIILASSQSGGSAVHIIDASHRQWKKEYEQLKPIGKLAEIVQTAESIRADLKTFKAPQWEKGPKPVYMMSDYRRGEKGLIEEIENTYESPVFLRSKGTKFAEKTDRSAIKDEKYFKRRDNRRTYSATPDEIVDVFTPLYNEGPGASFWGGHGNDPYMIRLNTIKKILDQANGKKTVLIYPELEDHTSHFEYVMNDYFYPLAKYCRETNAKIYVRTKHTFWSGSIYEPMWNGLVSGEYSDVFIPAMEETSDKSMELGVTGRLGIWASGATDSWGSRCARDNPSFDRLRQHANQKVPNHFLRNMVYHISLGAQYIDNFPVDQKYMSVLWELIATGALYVPDRQEIVSFSPVHLSMKRPDHDYLDRTSNVKWTTMYDADYEKNNPFVFSRLDGSWPGAPNTPWDFSSYAAGVKDRRADFLPSYENGIVLITPPQNGVFADQNVTRKSLGENLHPLYQDILKEYITDGRFYYSADGQEKYTSDEYYQVIEKDIKSLSEKLPLTVKGDVSWVAAQSAPKHLRLTIIDGGYLDPAERQALVELGSVEAFKIKDILTGEVFDISDGKAMINIPCGGFRFLDVELRESL